MLRSDRLALISLSTLLALAAAGCGINGSVDDLFSNTGGAGATSNVGGVGGDTPIGGEGGAGGDTTTSSGGSSTGGSSTGGSSTGGSSTGGSTGSTEDCLDGADNDGDGAVDCADTDCTPDFECVPNVPDGWTGYFHVTKTDYPTPPPPCAGGDDPSVYYAGPAGPAECTACTCGAPAGAACSPPKLTCWAGSGSCGGNGADWTPALQDGQCHKPGNLLGNNFALSCEVTEPSQVVSPGKCEPSQADFANKDTWENEVGACELPKGGGCAGNQACVPKAPGGAQAKLCIQKEGNTACPVGAFAQKAQTFKGGTDERSCSACTCGDGGTTCSGGSYTVYDADGCGNGGNENPATVSDGTCKNVSSLLDFNAWSMKATLPQAQQGACPPDGGAPQGQVNPDGPVTFCCVP